MQKGREGQGHDGRIRVLGRCIKMISISIIAIHIAVTVTVTVTVTVQQ